MRSIGLRSVDNVRDLGGIPTVDARVVRRGLIFRGSALSKICAEDAQLLFGRLGIGCVVDLRCGWERTAKPNAELPGVESLHIPFYDEEIVGIEYTEPAAGTKVVGRDVACDPDRFYRSLANPLTVGQMRQCIHVVLDRASRGIPVYQHCSGGKDRTGIMSLLTLIVLGAEPMAILEDYLETNISRDRNHRAVFERFLVLAEGDEHRAHELTMSHRARPENLVAFHEAVCEAYGSMEAFIENELGISSAERTHLRAVLTERAASDGFEERAASA